MKPPLSDHMLDEVHGLTLACLGGEATAREVRRLDELLLDSEDARRIYADAIQDSFVLHRWAAAEGLRANGAFNAEQADANWSPVATNGAEELFDLSEAMQPAPGVLHNTCRGAVSYFSQIGPLSYLIATIVLCAMLLSAWAYKITHVEEMAQDDGKPSIRLADDSEYMVVGYVSSAKDCVWAKDSLTTMVGASVPMGRKYELISGLMEINYTSGARVILEGPCEYTADSRAGGYLKQGKLVARVEKNDELKGQQSDIHKSSFINHHLFAITTPTAVITDLGTEFGVEVNENGNTTSHVFRGVVKVQAAGDMQMEVLLRANESARVKKDGTAGDARIITGGEVSAPPKFVRRLLEPPKEIDLLDIVAGGNGKGHRRERGINAATGWEDSFFVSVHRGGDREYRRVKRHEMIDGVFVPDGETGPVTIDSTGHSFDGFPDTTSDAFGSIWARAAKPRYYDESFDQSHSEWIYAMGCGKQFMPDGRGLLGLHPNAGITFDLAAIRRAFPGAFPSRFNAVAGMADAGRLSSIADGMVDFWVLVDGRLKLKRTKFRPQDGTFIVDVEIKPDDRFLTLVATDGGNTADSDWSVFGDPILRMTETDLDKQTEERPMDH